MGYARSGGKFRHFQYLYAGSAGFARTEQLCHNYDVLNNLYLIYIFVLSEWKTAWSLLYNPIDNGEEEIRRSLEAANANWLGYLKAHPPKIQEIKQMTKIISLESASSDFCLDDPNLTKSSAMANLKQKLTREINYDFKNVTTNVLNQKESNLCVPLSVSVLLRWAVMNDLKVGEMRLSLFEEYFSLENIFTILTMVVYPRSFAGFNLNPKKEEQKFQDNEIELLLRRMKFRTYLNESGWQIICHHSPIKLSEFDFQRVLLHQNFIFSRPLTVTGAYLNPDGSIIFHQMVVDRIENSEYILQNTLIDHSGSQVRIPLCREYYAPYEMTADCFNTFNDFIYFGPNNEFLALVLLLLSYLRECQKNSFRIK